MSRKRLKKLLDETIRAVKINDNIRVMLYPMKHKVASISLKTGVIRLNKDYVFRLDDSALKYILIHELIHYKMKSLSHNKAFYEELRKYYPDKVRKFVEKQIAEYVLSNY